MRKRANWRVKGLFLGLFTAFVPCTQVAMAADIPAPNIPSGNGYSSLSNTLLERAESEAARIRTLVQNGTLPKSRLEQAETAVADAQDEVILARTLYGVASVQDLTPADAQLMTEAAQRRVDRQAKLVAERRNLLDQGILSKSEFSSVQDELDNRQRTLDLAHTHAQISWTNYGKWPQLSGNLSAPPRKQRQPRP